ncbi:putative membrane protein [Streptohalobacillus salinus]|uniref:Putative membrane protein n=1 Tax=Streptohalobacillus salinus TaxID=621096 RepID=A0A2V3WF60_9BACI|nr:SHOCT domain-containing protein [Streptohalobacillus salinus]PXW92228.1 putative membrane protein [Streptohalobacillus salinus]
MFNRGHMSGYFNDGNFGSDFGMFNMGWLGLLFNLLVIGVIILIGVIIFKELTKSKRDSHQNHQGSSEQTNTTAINIVKERYAKGEISEEEYHRLIETLKS